MKQNNIYTSFPTLPNLSKIKDNADRKLKICIISPDIKGPVYGGGIGTAYYYLALSLKKWGHDVTILYTLGMRTLKGTINAWKDYFLKKGIEFVPLPNDHIAISNGKLGKYLNIQVRVYEWLKHRDFDLVHAPEWKAHVYYCLVAKKMGIAFGRTLFCIGAHSPTLWNILGNSQLITDEVNLIDTFMERKCSELADIVISPSQYMLNWMNSHGFNIPKDRCFVQPNIIHKENEKSEFRHAELPFKEKIKNIVFLGKLEIRKGIQLFCSAIGLLDKKLFKETNVIFLGRKSSTFNSVGYIKSQLKKRSIDYKIIDNLNSEQAMALLKRDKNCLVVIPSLVDNSPYTVMECIVNRVPFIASNVGGISELIDTDHIDKVTFTPHPRKLATKIESILRTGAFCAQTSFNLSENELRWKNWHRGCFSAYSTLPFLYQSKSPAFDDYIQKRTPIVSVCIPHFNRGNLLLQAVDSLRKQNYPAFEVIVVDDGSDKQESIEVLNSLENEFKERGWQIIRQSNKYPGAARNKAVHYSSGEYLLFMDDDNIAKEDEISKLVAILNFTNADALTSFRMRFKGFEVPHVSNLSFLIPALGAATAVGVLFNCYGDTNCFIKKNVFEKIGGFSEDYGIGKEDEEFLSNIVASGYNLMVIPEALYYYRGNIPKIREKHNDTLAFEQQFAGELRALRPYCKSISPEFFELLCFARGLNLERNSALKRMLLKRIFNSDLIKRASNFIPRGIKQYVRYKLSTL